MLSKQPDLANVFLAVVDNDGVTPLPLSTETQFIKEGGTRRGITCIMRCATNAELVAQFQKDMMDDRLDSGLILGDVRR